MLKTTKLEGSKQSLILDYLSAADLILDYLSAADQLLASIFWLRPKLKDSGIRMP